MRKRIKQKLGNRHHLLKQATREKYKKKGHKCIDFAIVPIGHKDKLAFIQEGYQIDYPFATHWFIQFSSSKDKYFFNNKIQYIIKVFPCNEKGRTSNLAPYQMIFYKEDSVDYVASKFSLIVNVMENDQYHRLS